MFSQDDEVRSLVQTLEEIEAIAAPHRALLSELERLATPLRAELARQAQLAASLHIQQHLQDWADMIQAFHRLAKI